MADKAKVKQKTKGRAVTRTAAGGMAGAAIGYLSSPKNRERIVAKVGKEKIKSQGAKLGTVTKEKLGNVKDSSIDKSNKTMQKLKSSTSNLLKKDKDDGEQEELVNEQEESDDEQEEQDNEPEYGGYKEIKEENDLLNDRLNSLEEKMEKLIEMQGAGDAAAAGKEEEDEAVSAEEDSDEEEEEEQKKSKPKKKKSSSKIKSSKPKKKVEEEEETGLENDDDTSASA